MGLEKPAASPDGGIFSHSSPRILPHGSHRQLQEYGEGVRPSWYACSCLSPIPTGALDTKADSLHEMIGIIQILDLEFLFTIPDRERCLVTLFAPANLYTIVNRR